MSTISTHILDTALGSPASGVQISLERLEGEDWVALGSGITNADGRVTDFTDGGVDVGVYRLVFHTERYCRTRGLETFYPFIPIVFAVDAADEHYHVPLLLSPFGYSTYRGS